MCWERCTGDVFDIIGDILDIFDVIDLTGDILDIFTGIIVVTVVILQTVAGS